MKSVSALTTISVLAVALFILFGAQPANADDHRSCSYRSVAGRWSYRLSGSILLDAASDDRYGSDAPVAGVGTFTMDRNGNFSGGGPYKSGNTLSQVAFTGTYTVNDDCTGTLSVDTVIDGNDIGILEFDQVFDDNSNGAHWTARSTELVVNVDAKKQ